MSISPGSKGNGWRSAIQTLQIDVIHTGFKVSAETRKWTEDKNHTAICKEVRAICVQQHAYDPHIKSDTEQLGPT